MNQENTNSNCGTCFACDNGETQKIYDLEVEAGNILLGFIRKHDAGKLTKDEIESGLKRIERINSTDLPINKTLIANQQERVLKLIDYTLPIN
jgi:hypothetical protein